MGNENVSKPARTSPPLRVSYTQSLFTPKTFQQGQKPAYSMTAMIDKAVPEQMAWLKQLYKDAEEALAEKWPDPAKRPRIPLIGETNSLFKDGDKTTDKQGVPLKEKNPESDIIICYMDIRSYGKGYEEYYERAKALGVRFLRGMPSDVLTDRNGMTIQVENSETSEIQVLHPDLVVLSVGIGPAEKNGEIAERFGIPLEDTGFIKPMHDAVDTVATLRPGIYIAGTATAPRDIPDSVASGGSAAMRAYIDAIRTRSE